MQFHAKVQIASQCTLQVLKEFRAEARAVSIFSNDRFYRFSMLSCIRRCYIQFGGQKKLWVPCDNVLLQVREVVKYAAERFIEVVPEIELPGHCGAALACYPELSCETSLPSALSLIASVPPPPSPHPHTHARTHTRWPSMRP